MPRAAALSPFHCQDMCLHLSMSSVRCPSLNGPRKDVALPEVTVRALSSGGELVDCTESV